MPEKEPVLAQYESVRGLTSRFAAAMPEKDAEFRPTSEVRTFADLVRHIASTEKTLHQAIRTGTWKWDQGITAETYPKLPGARAVLEETTAAGRELYRSLDLDRVLEASWGPGPIRSFLYEWLFHESHHRGQMATYLRLCGVKPPDYA